MIILKKDIIFFGRHPFNWISQLKS